jgi:hypothetical protein
MSDDATLRLRELVVRLCTSQAIVVALLAGSTHHFLDRSLELLELRGGCALRVGDDDWLLVCCSHGQRHQQGNEEGDKEELHVERSNVWLSVFWRVCQVGLIAAGGESDSFLH